MSKDSIISEGETIPVIGQSENFCAFCGKTTNKGIAVGKDLMRDYHGEEEWGHIECYINYVIDKGINNAIETLAVNPQGFLMRTKGEQKEKKDV